MLLADNGFDFLPLHAEGWIGERVTAEEKSEFRCLDKIVRRGVEAFMECCNALIEIQEKQLWRAGGWPTWEGYCIQVGRLSKSYSSRIINANKVASWLASDSAAELPIGNSVMPVSEFGHS